MSDLQKTMDGLNGRICTLMSPSAALDGRPYLTVEKIAPRGKKPPVVIASYCPFCGVKYPEATP